MHGEEKTPRLKYYSIGESLEWNMVLNSRCQRTQISPLEERKVRHPDDGESRYCNK
jgi:hypothetical protein